MRVSRGLPPRRGGTLAGFFIDSLKLRTPRCSKRGRPVDTPRCLLEHCGSSADASGPIKVLLLHAARDRARERMPPPAGRQSPAEGTTHPVALSYCVDLTQSLPLHI